MREHRDILVVEDEPSVQRAVVMICREEGLAVDAVDEAAKALELLDYARALHLDPVGFSFHVGSQTREATALVELGRHPAELPGRAEDAEHRRETKCDLG